MYDFNKVHIVKCEPQYFRLVASGIKKSEIRLNDRDYCAGDILIMNCFGNCGYLGESVVLYIDHVLDLKKVFDTDLNYVSLSVSRLSDLFPCCFELDGF